MVTIILSILLTCSIFYIIMLYRKNKIFKKDILLKINELNEPIRKGYYKVPLFTTSKIDNTNKPFDVIVYIQELERYTCGESKIKYLDLDIINIPDNTNKIGVINFAY